jgi:hypothetical protein
MRYKPRSIAALQVALGGLPDRMPVEAVSAKAVGELCKATAWLENSMMTTPQEHRPGSAIKVSRAGRAIRLSAKP